VRNANLPRPAAPAAARTRKAAPASTTEKPAGKLLKKFYRSLSKLTEKPAGKLLKKFYRSLSKLLPSDHVQLTLHSMILS